MDNVYVFSPLVLPFPYSRLARWINRHLVLPVLEKWMKVMNFDSPVIWTFLPTGFTLDLIGHIDKKLVVYYCIADFDKLVPDPRKVRRTESSVIKKADLVFVQGKELKKKCDRFNQNTHIFPFGVNMDVFGKYDHGADKPIDMRHLKGKIIGYVGGVHKHIDFELIRFIAEKNPDWTLAFIGPLQTDVSMLKDTKNVVFLGIKQHAELAGYIDHFDVCLVPYILNDYTETVYPTKLNEYLALGKAVVSTALPEVAAFYERHKEVIYTAGNKEEFMQAIKRALSEKAGYMRKERIEIARENSWDARISHMSALMEKEIEKRQWDREQNWKDNIIYFYKKARKKIYGFAIASFTCYFLLFHTPFIWFLAAPLKITDAPGKVDAIVVFGGGVGETGSPGKSTIERARFAAWLYLKGYADKIIFSSGYTYIYNDAENMKLIAMSMGVSGNDIILEQKANNAYENVIFSRDILAFHKWRSIILISSLYNMRRLSFVCNKEAHDMRILYVPVEKNQFYDSSFGVNIEQIRAIMHEYIGIVYYWFKGYL